MKYDEPMNLTSDGIAYAKTLSTQDILFLHSLTTSRDELINYLNEMGDKSVPYFKFTTINNVGG